MEVRTYLCKALFLMRQEREIEFLDVSRQS